jgi:hypothetical protein
MEPRPEEKADIADPPSKSTVAPLVHVAAVIDDDEPLVPPAILKWEAWLKRSGTTLTDYPPTMDWEQPMRLEVGLSVSEQHFVLKYLIDRGQLKPLKPVESPGLRRRSKSHLTMATKVSNTGLPFRPFTDDLNRPLYDKSNGINPPQERGEANAWVRLFWETGGLLFGSEVNARQHPYPILLCVLSLHPPPPPLSLSLSLSLSIRSLSDSVSTQKKVFGKIDPLLVGEAIIAVQDHLRVSFGIGYGFVEDQHEYKRRQELRSKSSGRKRNLSSPPAPFRGGNLHPTVSLFQSPTR